MKCLKIHWPVSMKKGSEGYKPENLTQTNIPATWRAMEALYDSGKARAIGVSNFSSKKLGDLLAVARVPPAVNQVECHPVWQQPKLHEFCQSRGVHLSVSMNRSRSLLVYSSFQITIMIEFVFFFSVGVFTARFRRCRNDQDPGSQEFNS